jgi:hypothetical protein
MSGRNVLELFSAPSRQDCLTAVSRALLRIRSNGWTRDALGKALDCSADTIDNATNETSMLCFSSIARLAFHFPDEFALIEGTWSCCAAPAPTPLERIAAAQEQIRKALADLERELEP